MIILDELADEFIGRTELVKRSKEVYSSLLKPLREEFGSIAVINIQKTAIVQHLKKINDLSYITQNNYSTAIIALFN
ncbi:hypothetical protein [Chroococcus sp. FPU101]|uniref:hypothetical protein n=1 Tax=Chroococcus sp. FPU101 TaxID=1974212 RepID=UPI001A8C3AD2|nr:hypothetical protein [Chroococcus sp. FPU101]GFE69051.1 hypothetical protein CFPU101_16610 [Chroococcus sp. FPU101]